MSTLPVISKKSPQGIAVIIPDGPSLTYAQIDRIALSFARQLIRRVPLSPGDVVSFALPNGIEFVGAFLGITRARLLAAPLNPAYKEEEFKFYIEDSRSKVVIVPRGSVRAFAPAVSAARALGARVAEAGWAGNEVSLEFFDEENGGKEYELEPQDQDNALLLHTSGTTGRPKGVPLTHKNLVTSMSNIAQTYKLSPNDRTYLVMPLFHVHGLVGVLLSSLLAGGSVVIAPRFSATSFWNDFTRYQCNWYSAVPTIHQIILRHPLPNPMPKIRFIRSASSSLAPPTFHALEKAMGCPVLEAYAMTEASHQMTSNPLPPLKRKPGTVGLPQGVEVVILDEKGRRVKEGEVCIRGENVTRGYLNNPSANASSFTKDRYFRTGDQGYFDDDGYLVLTGRIKELINRGGEKISPLEVDATLLEHPAVAEAVSFAWKDEMYGQEVHAAVVLRSAQRGIEEQLKEHCRKKLAEFKCPKKIHIMESIPKTATGKIQRRLLSAYFEKLEKDTKARL
ncbi:uncharacterized protein VTP21DRAFT_1556 [Calcarisporiella thermophila]|uniref:uncharacterized protein n=1 Tax=Calcarisporiella thermophila TaxID=911321 RepID=UPI00374471DD